ncbi:MAG: hypothetical protein M1818_008036 [Claussenomyces sp. TS43310]|nr:MAG: hypothetical protein M1818_008036 [Claussenomyces sp. TS43310]
MGLPAALVSADGQSVTAKQLSEQTGASALLIVRVMRVLIALGICDEVGEEVYLATPVTETLASPGFTGGTRYLYDLFVPAAAKITEYMHEIAFQNPQDKSLFEYTFQAPLWEYLGEHPAMQKDMMDYMAGRRKGGLRWLDLFPAASELGRGSLTNEDNAVLLVDIGGNQGHDLLMFKERHPDVSGRLVLMDLPEVVSKIQGPLEGIEVVPYSFFTPQPIKGAKAYFFRAICHDWPDKACQEFLGNTAKAMKADYSRLLINDFVLPDTKPDLHPALLDLMMMSMCSGAERTEKQWRALLESVGLEIVKIWNKGSVEAVIEAKLKA